jgi:hypothetical protein
MGTIVYRATKAQAIRDELANIETSARVLAHRVIGRRLWFLAEQRAGERAGTKWIGLTLIDSRGGEVAVKAMDESCGPCYYDCPLSFLDRADPPVGTYAPGWRMQVRAFHAARAQRRRSVGSGARVELAACVYVLHHSLARRGWEVRRESDGLAFRMTVRQLGRARLLPSIPSTPSSSATLTTPVAAAASTAAVAQPARGALA